MTCPPLGIGPGGPGRGSAAACALSAPGTPRGWPQRVLAANRGPYARSYAGQALGIATREMGDVAQAVRYLRAALAAAASCGDERRADVEASLGTTLACAGRSKEALRHLDAALGHGIGRPGGAGQAAQRTPSGDPRPHQRGNRGAPACGADARCRR